MLLVLEVYFNLSEVFLLLLQRGIRTCKRSGDFDVSSNRSLPPTEEARCRRERWGQPAPIGIKMRLLMQITLTRGLITETFMLEPWRKENTNSSCICMSFVKGIDCGTGVPGSGWQHFWKKTWPDNFEPMHARAPWSAISRSDIPNQVQASLATARC